MRKLTKEILQKISERAPSSRKYIEIGIHKNIYDAFVSDKYTEENKYANFYKDIKKILSEIKCEKYIKDSSSYEDGIIVCSSK